MQRLSLHMQMSPEEQAQKEDWIRQKVEEAMTLPKHRQPAKAASKGQTNGLSFDEAAFDEAYEAEHYR